MSKEIFVLIHTSMYRKIVASQVSSIIFAYLQIVMHVGDMQVRRNLSIFFFFAILRHRSEIPHVKLQHS